MNAWPHVEDSRHGVPMVKGTEIKVSLLWTWHREGKSFRTLFLRFPKLKRQAILCAIGYAYERPEQFPR